MRSLQDFSGAVDKHSSSTGINNHFDMHDMEELDTRVKKPKLPKAVRLAARGILRPRRTSPVAMPRPDSDIFRMSMSKEHGSDGAYA